MNNLFEESTPVVTEQHSIFVEKYRPANLQDYVGDKHLKSVLQSYIDKQDIPHLLFYNSCPGTGKTTAAKLLVKNIKCDYLYINASDSNGIEVVRTKIKGFASSVGFNSIKIVILDEFDGFTAEAQAALRNIIETYSLNTRFILTCNYIEKIIPPIVSRCQTFKVEQPNKKDMALLVKNILDKEGIAYKPEDIAYSVNEYYPDMRKIINYIQQSVLDKKVVINQHDAAEMGTKEKIVELLKSNNPTAFNDIRQIIANADVRHFEEYYKYLYEKTGEYAKGKDVVAILTLAEYLYQSSLVVDREITFMACIARLLKELR